MIIIRIATSDLVCPNLIGILPNRSRSEYSDPDEIEDARPCWHKSEESTIPSVPERDNGIGI